MRLVSLELMVTRDSEVARPLKPGYRIDSVGVGGMDVQAFLIDKL